MKRIFFAMAVLVLSSCGEATDVRQSMSEAAVESMAPPSIADPNHEAVTLKLTKWRTFTIGGVAKEELLDRIKDNLLVRDEVRTMVSSGAFATQETEEEIDTIILTPADFGFESAPNTTALFDSDTLAAWSTQNAERLDGHVVELLPAEAALQIRHQYTDQPFGESLRVAMKPIPDSRGDPSVFVVEEFFHTLRLSTSWAGVHDVLPVECKIVFRLRKVTQD